MKECFKEFVHKSLIFRIHTKQTGIYFMGYKNRRVTETAVLLHCFVHIMEIQRTVSRIWNSLEI